VNENVSQNVVGTAPTEKSEVYREGLFQGSTTAGIKTVMVCLRPDVLDATCFSHGSSIEYVVEMSVETSTTVGGNVYRGFDAYHS